MIDRSQPEPSEERVSVLLWAGLQTRATKSGVRREREVPHQVPDIMYASDMVITDMVIADIAAPGSRYHVRL
jgi:hypothetical protein